MTRNSVSPRDWIFVKVYGFLSFAKNMGRIIGKNMSKNLGIKLIALNNLVQMHLKLL